MANVQLNHTVEQLDDAVQRVLDGWRDVTKVNATPETMLKGTKAVNTTGEVDGNIETKTDVIDTNDVENDVENNKIKATIPEDAYYKDASLGIDYTSIADGIGLTSDKIVEGNTILGIEGTGLGSFVIETGEGLTGGPITGNGTISHGDTSTQESIIVDNVLINTIALDDFGHVTKMTSISFATNAQIDAIFGKVNND